MKALGSSLSILFRQILRDNIIVVICIAPLLLSLLFHYGLPLLSDYIESRYNFKSLQEYYILFDLFMIILAPYMFGFASAMIILGEMDEHIVVSFYASPLGKKGYLSSRLFLPVVISTILTLVLVSTFNLSGLSATLLLTLTLLSAIVSTVPLMVIVTFANNKVEGMALAKMTGLILMGAPVPFLISGDIQYVFAFLPTFWLGKTAINPGYDFIIPTLLCSALWLGLLYKKFNKRIAR